MIYDLIIGGQTKRSTLGQHPVKIDWDAMPDASKDFVIRYGLKQYLADGMAGAENVDAAKAGVDGRAAKLASGDLTRTRGEGKEAPDTEGSRALKLAKATIRKAMAAANVKATKEAVAEAATKMVASDEKWLKQAREQLADEAKLGQDVDISDLIALAAGAAE